MARYNSDQSMEPDLNDGKDWSEMDIADLRLSVAHGMTLKETTFLCRAEHRSTWHARRRSFGCVGKGGGQKRKGPR
jgi:hypothetical protein